MRKIIFLISFMAFGLSALFADEYVISKVVCFDVESGYNRELLIKYDDKDDVYYIQYSEIARSYWFTITPKDLKLLRENFGKAKEWAKLANEKKLSITKELPASSMNVVGIMNSVNKWYVTNGKINLSFVFISKFDENTNMVSLVMRGGVKESRQNSYIDIKFRDIGFINGYLDDMISAISEETVSLAKSKHNEEVKSAEMFY